jgi:hypothetical protein
VGPQQPGLSEQAGADVNRVAAVAEFDMEGFHGGEISVMAQSG